MAKKTIKMICFGPIACGPEYESPWEDVWIEYHSGKKKIVKEGPCIIVTPTTTEDGRRTITAKQLYDMYVRPVVDQEARKAVGKYATNEIVRNRLKVIKETRESIRGALTESIIKVKGNSGEGGNDLEDGINMKKTLSRIARRLFH